MSMRRLMAIAAGGLIMPLATGQLSPLHAQASATVEADAGIIREINGRNLLEIRLSELTRTRTTHPEVRAFGDRMITDHTNMHQQWTAVAGKADKFKPRLGDIIGEISRLEKVPTTEFDREYMATMIRHHQENVSYFQSAANSARSTQVRELLASGLPVLQQHLSMALQVGNRVGAAPAVATGGGNVPSNVPVATPTLPGGQNQPPAGQNPPPPSQNPPVTSENTPVNREDLKKDSKFIREAVADNTLEIRLAQLAEMKTTHPGVRQLAKRVLVDNTAMQNQWISMASRNGNMNLKPGMGRKHREKAQRLEKTPTTEFDRAYLTFLILNNRDYVAYFQKEGRASRSAQVRNLVANDLPTLQRHLTEAKQLGTQFGIDTTAVLRARDFQSYSSSRR